MPIIETNQKALEINLEENIYGSFAEIGAGQEVARLFFQAGAASGTIAKTMSAYDKKYSDEIYGQEAHGRYVCESRLYKMLTHEYDLMEQRLREERPNCNFFSFADTISAINFAKTNKGSGWMGVRFQLAPDSLYNDVVIHVKMHDNDNTLQQQAVGILGVNLVYACFHYSNDMTQFILSLRDSLRDRIEIDMIRATGPNFIKIDNRLLSLRLVQSGLSDVAMFDANGVNMHPSEVLYKKSLLVVRGSYRPLTHVNMDMIKTATEQFKQEEAVNSAKMAVLAELTLDNLRADGEIDEQDYLDRCTLLSRQGQMTMVTNCEKHHRLIRYFSDYKVPHLGIVVGARVLLNLINETYTENMDGRLLSAFGELFTRNVRMYLYPALQEGSEDLMTTQNLPIPEGISFLYRYLLEAHHIVDIKGFNPAILHIYSTEVLRLLRADEGNWEENTPPSVAQLIKEKCLFNFPCQRLEFDY